MKRSNIIGIIAAAVVIIVSVVLISWYGGNVYLFCK